MGYTADIELLNDHLNNEVERLKEELKESQDKIEKLEKGLAVFANDFIIMKSPFGLPNDTKMIDIMVHKSTYENEIKPYNEMLKKVKDAIIKKDTEMKAEQTKYEQEEMTRQETNIEA